VDILYTWCRFEEEVHGQIMNECMYWRKHRSCHLTALEFPSSYIYTRSILYQVLRLIHIHSVPSQDVQCTTFLFSKFKDSDKLNPNEVAKPQGCQGNLFLEPPAIVIKPYPHPPTPFSYLLSVFNVSAQQHPNINLFRSISSSLTP
jgi:hypothetical protein